MCMDVNVCLHARLYIFYVCYMYVICTPYVYQGWGFEMALEQGHRDNSEVAMGIDHVIYHEMYDVQNHKICVNHVPSAPNLLFQRWR